MSSRPKGGISIVQFHRTSTVSINRDGYLKSSRLLIQNVVITVRSFFIKSDLMYESSLKTSNFGLKPGKWLIFNCPDLKVGAIDIRDNQGFSHINEIY